MKLNVKPIARSVKIDSTAILAVGERGVSDDPTNEMLSERGCFL